MLERRHLITAAANRRPSRRLVSSLACAVSTGLALIWVAGPIRDPDVWWHVRLGHEMVAAHSVFDQGLTWSTQPPVNGSWVTTQWLAEVLMAAVQSLAGWSGIGWLRLFGEVLLLAVLSWATFVDRDLDQAALPFCIGALGSALFVQDRPQQLTYIMCPVVGWVVVRYLTSARLPAPTLVIVVIVAWAQFHPGWILVPGLLAVLVVGSVLEGGAQVLSTPRVRWALWLFPLTLAAGTLTPAGPQALLSSGRIVASASAIITEWQAPSMGNIGPVLFCVMVALSVASWARHEPRPDLPELIVVLALCAFASLAFRNVVPALLVLTPLTAWRRTIANSRPARGGLTTPQRGVVWTVVGALGLIAAGIQVSSPAIGGRYSAPAILAEIVRQEPVRVLPTYNLGGFVAGMGGDDVRVTVDGRTDYYGPGYLHAYDDMVRAKPGWRTTFDDLAPDLVVLNRSDPLLSALEEDGWDPVLTENGYVLLDRRDSS